METIDGDRHQERMLHIKYAALRLHGEWFSYSEDMEIHVNVKYENKPLERELMAISSEEMHARATELCNLLGGTMPGAIEAIKMHGYIVA